MCSALAVSRARKLGRARAAVVLGRKRPHLVAMAAIRGAGLFAGARWSKIDQAALSGVRGPGGACGQLVQNLCSTWAQDIGSGGQGSKRRVFIEIAGDLTAHNAVNS